MNEEGASVSVQAPAPESGSKVVYMHTLQPPPPSSATTTHLLGSPQRSLVNEEGASVTRGSVRERRLKMQRRWLAMQANLARLHGMLRSSDAGGNGRRYGEGRGAFKRI